MSSHHSFRLPPGKNLFTVGLHSSPGDAQLAAILGGVLTPHGLSVLQPPGIKTADSLCHRLIFGNELTFVCPAHSLGQTSNPPGPPGSSSPFLQVMVGLTADSFQSKQVHLAISSTPFASVGPGLWTLTVAQAKDRAASLWIVHRGPGTLPWMAEVAIGTDFGSWQKTNQAPHVTPSYVHRNCRRNWLGMQIAGPTSRDLGAAGLAWGQGTSVLSLKVGCSMRSPWQPPLVFQSPNRPRALSAQPPFHTLCLNGCFIFP